MGRSWRDDGARHLAPQLSKGLAGQGLLSHYSEPISDQDNAGLKLVVGRIASLQAIAHALGETGSSGETARGPHAIFHLSGQEVGRDEI